MAKYWFYEGQSWRLPADENVRVLREKLRDATRNGELFPLIVEMNNDPRQRTVVILNPAAMGYIAVVEMDDQGRVIE